MVPPPQQPAAGEAEDTAAAAAAASADVTAVTPEDAWRERHAAEVLWGLPPTVAGAVVRLYTTVLLLHGALERFLRAPPPPPKATGGCSPSASPPPAAVSPEDCEGLVLSGKEAGRLAVRLADAAVAACGGGGGDAAGLGPEEAQTTPAEKDQSALLNVGSALQDLLRSVCKLLDAVKVQLGAAVHSVRDEGWVLSQLRLVEGVAESAELLAVLFELPSPARTDAATDTSASPSWREGLGHSVDGWQKAMKHANGTNWTGVQGWFVTWNTRR